VGSDESIAEIGRLLARRALTPYGEDKKLDDLPWLVHARKSIFEPSDETFRVLINQLRNIGGKTLFTQSEEHGAQAIQACTLDRFLVLLLISDSGLNDFLSCVVPPSEPGLPFKIKFHGKDILDELRVQPVFCGRIDSHLRTPLVNIVVAAWLQLRYQLYSAGVDDYKSFPDLYKRSKFPKFGEVPSRGTIRFFQDFLPEIKIIDYKMADLEDSERDRLRSPVTSPRTLRILKNNRRNAKFLSEKVFDRILKNTKRLNDSRASVIEMSWHAVEPEPISIAAIFNTEIGLVSELPDLSGGPASTLRTGHVL